jgi:hypothetical protein
MTHLIRLIERALQAVRKSKSLLLEARDSRDTFKKQKVDLTEKKAELHRNFEDAKDTIRRTSDQ